MSLNLDSPHKFSRMQDPVSSLPGRGEGNRAADKVGVACSLTYGKMYLGPFQKCSLSLNPNELSGPWKYF